MRYGQSLNDNIAMCDYVLSRLRNPIHNGDELHSLVVEWLEAMRDGLRAELRNINAYSWEPSPFDAQG